MNNICISKHARKYRVAILVIACLSYSLVRVEVSAVELTDKMYLDVGVTGVIQAGDYQQAVSPSGALLSNESAGSLVVDMDFLFQASQKDQFVVTASAAKGNGLKGLEGVSLAVNADDLEDDLKNINGGGRDNLLTAWYRRSEPVGHDGVIRISGGIIDAADYIDDNAYADDENTQFMNEVFVNRFFLPSYDGGAAVEYEQGSWHVHGVWMSTSTESDENGVTEYDFFGSSVRYTAHFPFGQGNYRLFYLHTSESFPVRNNPLQLTNVDGVGISLDQQIGSTLGIFVRFGTGEGDTTELQHDRLYSAGVNINGRTWGRADDTIGIGIAELRGTGEAASDIAATQVIEAYTRFGLNAGVHVSVDLQYVRDRLNDGAEPRVFVVGVRLNANF